MATPERRSTGSVAGLIAASVLAILVVAALLGFAVWWQKDSQEGGELNASGAQLEVPAGAPAFTAAQLAQQPAGWWVTNGGSLRNQRYSPLAQIDSDNVDELKGVWRAHLGSGMKPKHSGEAQPLYYDGVVYVVTGDDDVFALDVETGEQRWVYRANLDPKITTVCCGWTSRGVALGDGRIYVGLLDASVRAIDQQTGEEVWRKQVGSWPRGETITSAPLYYDGMVITGMSGGEYGIRGRLTALDARTGDERWRFWTVPGPGEPNYGTWEGDSWRRGGAPVWQTPAVDPELGLVYFSTGNTSPDFDGSRRGGDNLYTGSVVALDVDTGRYRCHYQQVHHDIWDYDAPAPVVLFDVELGGETRKAMAEPSKTGWVYILDRTNCKPLLEIEERPVPQLARQKTARTQPYPTGDSFVPQHITQEQADELSEGSEDPPWRYVNEGRIFTPFWGKPGIIAKPSTLGGNNWPPPSYSPETGFLYVCAADSISLFTSSKAEYDPQAIRRGIDFLGSEFSSPEGTKIRGTFTAMDMRTNRIAWQEEWEDACYSGTLATAGGLVFVGRNDGRLQAYDSENGDELWSFQTGAGANAPATTFAHDGKQYVVLYAAGNSLIGSTHGDNVWLFSLDGELGEAEAPQTGEGSGEAGGDGDEATTTQAEGDGDPTKLTGNAADGESVFDQNCASCHGNLGQGGHVGPNLQKSQAAENREAVISIVRQGSGQMPSFEGNLSPQEIADVAAYVTQRVAPRG
jgi:alcohol dehydrogenase (cytochrome c)